MKHLSLAFMVIFLAGCTIPVTLVNENQIYWERKGGATATPPPSTRSSIERNVVRSETEDGETKTTVEETTTTDKSDEVVPLPPVPSGSTTDHPVVPVLRDIKDLPDDERLIVLAEYVVQLRLYAEELRSLYTQGD